MSLLDDLAKTAGYAYGPTETLQRAMIPKGANTRGKDNDVLEFFGDSILAVVVTERLVRQNPNKGSGALSRLRLKYITGDMLTYVGNHLGLGSLLVYGSGLPRPTDKMIGDAVEAIVAAVYTDLGMKAAGTFVDSIMAIIDRGGAVVAKNVANLHAKSVLQEYAHKKYGRTPTYERVPVLNGNGTSHTPAYRVRVNMPDGMFAEATGATRKEAEIEAARVLVDKLGLEYS